MTEWARNNPSEFYRIAARLIPQEINAETKNVSDVPFGDDRYIVIDREKAEGAIHERIAKIIKMGEEADKPKRKPSLPDQYEMRR